MIRNQSDVESVMERFRQGEITVDEANIEMVRAEGVRLIVGRTPKDIRSALNKAVTAGRLGHLPKEGHKPEAYFNPNSRPRAITMRNETERLAFSALKGVFA